MVPNREITLGSACTGSGSEHVAAWHFQHAARKGSAQAFRIRSVFACEIMEAKRTWIKGVHAAFPGSARRVSNPGAAPSSPGSTAGESKPGSATSAPGSASGVPSPASGPNAPGSAQGVSGSVSDPTAPGSVLWTDPTPCLFCDIADLATGVAYCETHKKNCKVPHCTIFVCCTSCKDLSRLTPGSISLRMPWSVGGSAQTFHGMLSYIEKWRPAIILFENVEAIKEAAPGDSEETNLDIVLAEFASRGYECQHMSGDSSKYGVPQHRKRFYIIGVLVIANPHFSFVERSIHDTFDTLRGLIRVGQRTAPCASQVLYDGTDAQVLTNLTERSARTTNAAQQCYSVHNTIGAVIASGVSWSTVRPPAWMKTSPWARCVTTQQLHVLSFPCKQKINQC